MPCHPPILHFSQLQGGQGKESCFPGSVPLSPAAGKSNQPDWVKGVAQAIAEVSASKVTQTTSQEHGHALGYCQASSCLFS